jgi:hypothetical protein
MDIEKLIKRFLADAADWAGDYHIKVDLWDAATALSTLQAENEKLREMYQKEKAVCHATQAELEQTKQERDVAIEQLHGNCLACVHYAPNHNEGLCRFCCFEVARDKNVEINDNWKWRGPKEV